MVKAIIFYHSWQRQSDNGSGNPFGDDELPFTNEPSPTPHHAVDRRDIFSYRVDSGRVAVGSQAEDEDEEEDITGV